MERIKGIIEIKSRGYGFVRQEDGDVFIPPDAIKGAFSGEEVAVVVYDKPGGARREGRVEKVISKLPYEVVGTIEKGANYMFLMPDDTVIPDIYIPKSQNGGAKHGDKAVVNIEKRATRTKSPEGSVTELLGGAYDAGVDIKSIARRFNLKEEFPQKVNARAEKLRYNEKDENGRLNLCDEMIFTIDNDTAKDLDDAVSLERTSNGYRLGVHIADVANYVNESGDIDIEARKRGTSVYFMDTVIPMLPKIISDNLCSLNPDTKKLTVSCFMDIDKNGKVCATEVYRSIICSRRRMTYSNVNKMLAGDENTLKEFTDVADSIELMAELAAIMRDKREQKGSIDFELPEAEIILDKNGVCVDVRVAERGAAEKIIEEFMLAANVSVAEYIGFLNLPCVYRVHEKPNEEKLKELAVFLSKFGIRIKMQNGVHPKTIQKVLNDTKDTKEHNVIATVTLRSMSKAKYSVINEGHFGLSFPVYCHFTSPIRRYPDLCVHRILTAAIEGRMTRKYLDYLDETLAETSQHSGIMERGAQEAERAAQDMKMAEYMSYRIGEQFMGVVSGVTGFGIFVELDNMIEGMVSLASMQDDYYVYYPEQYCVMGEKSGRKISLGDTVEVIVAAADKSAGKIEFKIAE